jgi:hypothetical protein
VSNVGLVAVGVFLYPRRDSRLIIVPQSFIKWSRAGYCCSLTTRIGLGEADAARHAGATFEKDHETC